jgi:DNA-binding NtrC family response regulator
MRVMIVDDDETLVREMQELFVARGYDVVTFTKFEPAKCYLADARIDVLVAGVRLGAYNGLQLVMLAKAERPDMTAVVLSGMDDPVLRQDATSIGASFRVKPVPHEQLLTGIELASGRPMMQ